MNYLFAFPAEEPIHFCRLALKKYSRSKPGSDVKSTIQGMIRLPMPTQLVDDYNIRVNDACGDALVQTFTIVKDTSPSFVLQDFIVNCKLVDCNTVTISFFIQNLTPFTGINYPLNVTVTVFPPNGGIPIILHQTISSGSTLGQVVSQNIPFFYGTNYNCNIDVTDSCGNTVSMIDNQIDGIIKIYLYNQDPSDCYKGININSCFYVLPLTVTFLSAPAGFNPNLFNSNHPGPFYNSSITYSANAINDMPDGDYLVMITDA